MLELLVPLLPPSLKGRPVFTKFSGDGGEDGAQCRWANVRDYVRFRCCYWWGKSRWCLGHHSHLFCVSCRGSRNEIVSSPGSPLSGDYDQSDVMALEQEGCS